MHNILFDPGLLVAPADTSDRGEVERWLTSLEMWASVAGTTPHAWYHLTDLVVKYLGHERFPSFHLLRTLQQRYHLNIALPTIATLVNEVFLQDACSFRPALETHLFTYGFVVEPTHDTIAIHPGDLSTQWPGEICNAVTSLLAEAGVGKWKGEPFSTNVVIATARHRAIEHELSVAGEATILSTQNEQEHISFSVVFPLLGETKALTPTDIRAIWELSEEEVQRAIARQFQDSWETTGAQPLPFVLGPQFFASVRERGADANRVVLTKIVSVAAAVIAESAMAINCDLHPLRESSAPNSPQRTRQSDGAKGWRLTLTHKGAGWRMHYWHISNASGSSIEFSNILKKHEPEVIF
ncbi:MAG: hypothetical protein H0U76_23860 [Ktedonobacteraceae bacterium]|nr:hypothetical protein [Ktedonobacteraceae bacterium]